MKKDNYGIWKHTGVSFECRVSANRLEIGNGNTDDGWKMYSLRRLHSKHSENKMFRRMIATIYGKFYNYGIVIIDSFIMAHINVYIYSLRMPLADYIDTAC